MAPPIRHVDQGDIIWKAGQQQDHAFSIVKGYVRLFREHEGSVLTFHQLGPGELLGAECLIEPQALQYSARAASDVALIPIGREELRLELQQTSSWLSRFVMRTLRDEIAGNREYRTHFLALYSVTHQA
ncbi:cyclic nucleotide-binding domain-containing protein, partial [bacterium]|nr:cyclic nucleotide-binding domain-containing protein [bacterium]